MSEQEISRDDVRALIGEVFEQHPLPHLQRVETDRGLTLRFVVVSERLGGLLCEYPVEPYAEALLRAYPNKRAAAYSLLATTLTRLPFGLHLGMENIADMAEFETHEVGASYRAMMKNGGQPPDFEASKAFQKEILKKMDARNRVLVRPVTSGPSARVTAEMIAGAIGLLLNRGKTKAQTTVLEVASLLGCTDSAIYKALKKRGLTFEQLLDMLQRAADN
jgi:hypothetical protein